MLSIKRDADGNKDLYLQQYLRLHIIPLSI